MLVTGLPTEVLASLPEHLDSIVDLYSLISTSRRLYHTCSTSQATYPPKCRPDLSPKILRPDNVRLLVGIARQIGDWAVINDDNRQRLYSTIEDSQTQGLLDLGIEISRVSLRDV